MESPIFPVLQSLLGECSKRQLRNCIGPKLRRCTYIGLKSPHCAFIAPKLYHNAYNWLKLHCCTYTGRGLNYFTAHILNLIKLTAHIKDLLYVTAYKFCLNYCICLCSNLVKNLNVLIRSLQSLSLEPPADLIHTDATPLIPCSAAHDFHV